MLDESNAYYEATRAFEKDYKAKNQGKNARKASEDFEIFHKKQYNERSLRFAGDARSAFMWKKQASQIGMSSTGRGIAYSEQQDRVYRKEVTAEKTALSYQKIADAPSDVVVNNLRKVFNAEVAALNSQEATTLIMAKTDEQTAITRIKTAIANSDVDGAKRLLGEYKEAGVMGNSTDDMIKLVSDAEVNDTAYNISLQVLDELPEGTKTEKLELARKLSKDDPDIYKQARYQVMQDHSGQIAQQKEQNDLITDMFSAKIQAANTPVLRRQVELEIMNTPMEDKIRTKLLKSNAQGLKAPLTSSVTKLREAEQLVARESITSEQFERDYKWDLSKQDFDLQMSRIKDIGGNRVNAYNLDMEDRLSIAFAEDGKKAKSKTTRFKGMMNQFVKEYQTANNKLPGNKEMKEQENWLLEQVIYDENTIWFDSTTERFMADRLDAKDFDIPSNLNMDIVRDLKAANIEPTKENRVKAYKRYLMDRGQ